MLLEIDFMKDITSIAAKNSVSNEFYIFCLPNFNISSTKLKNMYSVQYSVQP